MTKERRKDLDYKNEMDLTETSSEDVNWNELTQRSNDWRVSPVNLGSNTTELVSQLITSLIVLTFHYRRGHCGTVLYCNRLYFHYLRHSANICLSMWLRSLTVHIS
jgi:hypothetical protein